MKVKKMKDVKLSNDRERPHLLECSTKKTKIVTVGCVLQRGKKQQKNPENGWNVARNLIFPLK